MVRGRIVRTAGGRRMLRVALALRGYLFDTDARLAKRTVRWARRLQSANQIADAIVVYKDAERRSRDPAHKLAFSVRRTRLELKAGILPEDLWDRIRDFLQVADDLVAAGDLTGAGERLHHAFGLAFHRTLHLEDRRSALADDPGGFLAPLRASAAFAAVESPTRRTQTPRAATIGRPRRLLFVVYALPGNGHFVEGIIADYRATPGVEVRTIELKEFSDSPWRARPLDLVTRRLHQSLASDPVTLPDEVREVFDWADTIFVDWAHIALPWVSLLPEVTARLVVRFHSYEAFTPHPLYADWSAIDDVVFVSPHIRALVEATVPALLAGPRLHTIPNRNLFTPYRRPKLPSANHTLGMVGWNSVTKDPAWTLELLEELLRHDDRWRLRLLGHDFSGSSLTGSASRYGDDVERRLDALGAAVERPGYCTDMPEALRHVGVVVSSSRREGTHEGLLQGTASGAWPVVRDWPYVARWGGARTMVRDDWVVDTPKQAAAALLNVAEDPVRFGLLREEAAAWVASRYDWSVVRPALDALLLDGAKA